ncbi:pilus assembly protein TadG-related protein [Pseudoduganella sp. GCM10020061]|uniref:pilus assembly protein TadG-related protein n=1 Tax=Pseudoduganella sp. GCM10020061 TaxID=3317345 RepID=UPI00364506BC
MKLRDPACQHGTFTIQFAVMLAALLSTVGLALDVSRVYMRQAEMRSFAESAALAAAHELDGTPAGVDAAVQQALAILATANGLGATAATLQNGALQLGASPDGPWTTAGAAAGLSAAQLDTLRFARVDTSTLDGALTQVERFFAPEGTTPITFGEVAVAGQELMPIAPLAVCAMSETPAYPRKVQGMVPDTFELVEYGFRRGVSYNLLGLNPAGDAPAHFVVNPVEFPEDGRTPRDSNFSASVVRPFICTGSLMRPTGNKLYVEPDFPLELIPELNSRFKLASACHATTAWPDKNVMEYKDVSWLTNTPTLPYAQDAASEATDGDNRLAPMADLEAAARTGIPAGEVRTRDSYGNLWAYARPVQYSATAAGHVGDAFGKSAVPLLYPVDNGGSALTLTWDDDKEPPYIARRIGSSTTPSGTSVLFRRIINVPLLDCPVSGKVATVLAIGRFALTSRAVAGTSPYIAGEFGGLLTGARPLMTRLYR